MGRNARALAMENFDTRKNARRLLGIYERVLKNPEQRAAVSANTSASGQRESVA
jgi:hypothetical protein